MRRFNVTAALVAAALAAGAATGARATDAPPVPPDVKIPVELTQQVTSLTAHVGDTFTFKTTRDEKLGTLDVPSGTPGHGRLAEVTPAQGKMHGSVALQADSLDLPGGRVVWVNIDTTQAPVGHLSDKHTHFAILPLPIGIAPGTYTSTSGNMVLDPGTPFRVVTIPPRTVPAPLMTAAPTPAPAATTVPSS